MPKLIVFSLFIILVFSGCTSTHYGYKKAEWEAMTQEEQLAAIEEFEKLKRAQYTLIYGDSRENATEAFRQRALDTPK